MKRYANIIMWLGVLCLLFLLAAVCAAEPVPGGTTLATESDLPSLPPRGKVVSDTAPPKAVVGMIWLDTTSNVEYIFDGSNWVPHAAPADPPQQ